MKPLPVETRWTKIPGPRFVGGPDGRIIDIEDWRVQVQAHLLLQSVVELSRYEANDPLQFAYAQERAVAMIYNKVFGSIHDKLRELEHELAYGLGPHANPETMRKYREIVQMMNPNA